MVNMHGCPKMMVNRCIELLRTRIGCVQTRHIGKRVLRPAFRTPMATNPDNLLVRELAKTKEYQMNKRRSMWEQNDPQPDLQSPTFNWDQTRLDDLMYTEQDIKERSYDCTWVNFPETTTVAKPKVHVDYVASEDLNESSAIPHRRRSCDERPETAKPYDEGARHFITHWDNNNAMINRSRYVRASDNCPPPAMACNVIKSSRDRKKQFFY